MEIITDKKRIETVFNRGVVVEVLPSKEKLIEEMTTGRKLRIYIGADPTSDSLHLSHAKNYMFLEELRQLGHEVIVLVGDFTAQIGDPTDKTAARVQLSEKQIESNVRNWIDQIKPLMDFESKDNPPKIRYNSEWLTKMSWQDELLLASNLTVQRILERDMFQKRIKNDIPIYLHEFQYPLMQGYDSVAMDVDVELCGIDQVFNALVGRTLLKRLKNKEKFIIVVNLMENPKTGELMSKSKGTGIFLSLSPDEMFGAIMAQPDEMIEVFYINCTRLSLEEKDEILALEPHKAKARVAFEIVKKLHGEDRAKSAQETFKKVFSKKELPENIKSWNLKEEESDIVNVLMGSGMVKSKAEAKRLIDQKAVKVNNTAIKDWTYNLKSGDTIKVGPRKFLKIS